MKTSDSVTVFHFSQFELGSDAPAVSSYKATRETIARTSDCRVLEGTGEEVPRHALDSKGRYRRVATGWGELPSP
jgi:hypothetical protein